MNEPGSPAQPDTADAARAIAGDRAAFVRLVHRTARLVLATILLDVRDPHLADDLTQETFLKAWRAIGTLNDPSRFNAWLIGIAKTVCIDARRHANRKKRIGPHGDIPVARPQRVTGSPNVNDADLLVDPAPGPLEVLSQSDQRDRLIEALKTLPEAQRNVLSLRYLAGADYDTIAKQLNLTDGALRGLLHRGLAELRKRFTCSTGVSPVPKRDPRRTRFNLNPEP